MVIEPQSQESKYEIHVEPRLALPHVLNLVFNSNQVTEETYVLSQRTHSQHLFCKVDWSLSRQRSPHLIIPKEVSGAGSVCQICFSFYGSFRAN